MHFLIFIPGPDDSNALAIVGLESLAAGAVTETSVVGPKKLTGTLFTWPSGRTEPPQFDPSEWSWIPATGTAERQPGRYWVGINKYSPPTPRDLWHSDAWGGFKIELGDGQVWLVPNCGQLPHGMRLTGEMLVRRPGYAEWRQEIVGRARDWEQRFRDSAIKNAKQATPFALQALALNYRITPEVAKHLGLFSDGDDAVLHVCLAHCVGAKNNE